MNNLRKFNWISQYNSAKEGDELVKPSVSLVIDNAVVKYDDVIKKLIATYSDGRTYMKECDGQPKLTSGDTRPSGYVASAMTDAIIGGCTTELDALAFEGCSSLTSVTISDNVTKIGSQTFANCSGFTSIDIPSGVTHIGNGCFANCSGLTSIDIPSGLTAINISTFQNCSSLEDISIPYNVTGIDLFAFQNCSSLTSVTIPNSVTSIGDNAFEGCSSLTSIVIPNSVTSIGSSAFRSCTSLLSATIGSGVTSINNNAFRGCTSLTSITINATTPPTIGVDIFYNTNNCPIYVPCESVNAYKAASGWSSYANRIKPIQNTCPTKLSITYSDGSTYEEYCDGNTTITSADTHPNGYVYSAMTDFEIGDCVTELDGYAFTDLADSVADTYRDKVLDLRNITTFGSVVFSMHITGNHMMAKRVLLRDVTRMSDGSLSSFMNTDFVLDNATPPTWALSQGVYPMPPSYTNYKIYVPDEAVATYKTNRNWSVYTDQIKPMSEMPTE